jgi:hypothetical protein
MVLLAQISLKINHEIHKEQILKLLNDTLSSTECIYHTMTWDEGMNCE